MLAQIRRFNDGAGQELIMLKIGAHVGECLAVTLNERLDYFGRTVNLAARVQGLAAENEIYLSDDVPLTPPRTCWRRCSAMLRLSASKASSVRSPFTHCAPDTKARPDTAPIRL